jgi:hypothetical protein
MAGTILSIISGIINVMMIVCFFIFFALIFMGFNWV